MVGRLRLQEVPASAKRAPESPDSSPASWLLSAGLGQPEAPKEAAAEPGARAGPPAQESSPDPRLPGRPSRLCPLSFGEAVELDPLLPKEIRYTSSVTYDSDRHFIHDVSMPVGLGVSSCSQTVVCAPHSTWRSYKAEVRLQPRPQPRRFASTTIVYPKRPKTVYTTTLDYNCRKCLRRFRSSVELDSAGTDSGPDGS